MSSNIGNIAVVVSANTTGFNSQMASAAASATAAMGAISKAGDSVKGIGAGIGDLPGQMKAASSALKGLNKEMGLLREVGRAAGKAALDSGAKPAEYISRYMEGVTSSAQAAVLGVAGGIRTAAGSASTAVSTALKRIDTSKMSASSVSTVEAAIGAARAVSGTLNKSLGSGALATSSDPLTTFAAGVVGVEKASKRAGSAVEAVVALLRREEAVTTGDVRAKHRYDIDNLTRAAAGMVSVQAAVDGVKFDPSLVAAPKRMAGVIQGMRDSLGGMDAAIKSSGHALSGTLGMEIAGLQTKLASMQMTAEKWAAGDMTKGTRKGVENLIGDLERVSIGFAQVQKGARTVAVETAAADAAAKSAALQSRIDAAEAAHTAGRTAAFKSASGDAARRVSDRAAEVASANAAAYDRAEAASKAAAIKRADIAASSAPHIAAERVRKNRAAYEAKMEDKAAAAMLAPGLGQKFPASTSGLMPHGPAVPTLGQAAMMALQNPLGQPGALNPLKTAAIQSLSQQFPAAAQQARNLTQAVAGLGLKFPALGAAAGGAGTWLRSFVGGANAATQAANATGGSVGVLGGIFTRVRLPITLMGKQLGTLSSSTGFFSKEALIAVGAAGTLAGIGGSIKIAGEVEQIKTGFTALLGSAGAAETMFSDINEFSKKTPFSFPFLAKTTKNMLGLGFAATDIIPILTKVGDRVAATGGGVQEMESVVRALGQMKSYTKIQAEEMGQMADAGVGGYKLLAEASGKTEAELRALSKEGALDAQTWLPILIDAIGGGNVQGMMQKQSATLLGALNNLGDAVYRTAIPIGQIVTRAFGLQSGTLGVTDWLDALATKLNSSAPAIISSINTIVAPFGVLYEGMKLALSYVPNVAPVVTALATVATSMIALAVAAKSISMVMSVVSLAITAPALLIGIAVLGTAVYILGQAFGVTAEEIAFAASEIPNSLKLAQKALAVDMLRAPGMFGVDNSAAIKELEDDAARIREGMRNRADSIRGKKEKYDRDMFALFNPAKSPLPAAAMPKSVAWTIPNIDFSVVSADKFGGILASLPSAMAPATDAMKSMQEELRQLAELRREVAAAGGEDAAAEMSAIDKKTKALNKKYAATKMAADMAAMEGRDFGGAAPIVGPSSEYLNGLIVSTKASLDGVQQAEKRMQEGILAGTIRSPDIISTATIRFEGDTKALTDKLKFLEDVRLRLYPESTPAAMAGRQAAMNRIDPLAPWASHMNKFPAALDKAAVDFAATTGITVDGSQAVKDAAAEYNSRMAEAVKDRDEQLAAAKEKILADEQERVAGINADRSKDNNAAALEQSTSAAWSAMIKAMNEDANGPAKVARDQLAVQKKINASAKEINTSIQKQYKVTLVKM